MSLPFEFPPSPLIRDAAVRLEINPSSKILDVGSCSGRNSIFLASLGHTVLGITNLVEEARAGSELAARKGLSRNCKFVVGDARQLPLRKAFDIVIVNEVLHQMSKNDSHKVIDSVQSYTRQGGLNIVSGYLADPDHASALNRNRSFSPGELYEAYNKNGWDIMSYTEDDFSSREINGRQHINSLAYLVAHRSW